MINVEYIGVNFNDKLKFENNSIHASKNIIDWIFTDNENKHKNLHHICDDDDDDDDDDDLLKTHNLLTIKEIVYDDNNNNNPLNDEEYDFINSKYYSLINRIKNEYIENAKRPLTNKEYHFSFDNHNKYRYFAATKPNALLAKSVSNRDNDKFCLNCFGNFKNEELIEKHKKVCESSTYTDRIPPKEFKVVPDC